jgi:hypothetical protein
MGASLAGSAVCAWLACAMAAGAAGPGRLALSLSGHAPVTSAVGAAAHAAGKTRLFCVARVERPAPTSGAACAIDGNLAEGSPSRREMFWHARAKCQAKIKYLSNQQLGLAPTCNPSPGVLEHNLDSRACSEEG